MSTLREYEHYINFHIPPHPPIEPPPLKELEPKGRDVVVLRRHFLTDLNARNLMQGTVNDERAHVKDKYVDAARAQLDYYPSHLAGLRNKGQKIRRVFVAEELDRGRESWEVLRNYYRVDAEEVVPVAHTLRERHQGPLQGHTGQEVLSMLQQAHGGYFPAKFFPEYQDRHILTSQDVVEIIDSENYRYPFPDDQGNYQETMVEVRQRATQFFDDLLNTPDFNQGNLNVIVGHYGWMKSLGFDPNFEHQFEVYRNPEGVMQFNHLSSTPINGRGYETLVPQS